MTGQIRIEEVGARRGGGVLISKSVPRLKALRGIGQKFLIIDDDPVFCRIVSKLCNLNGIASTFHTSLKELDSIDLSEYTGAIIDVHLGLANGVEVADYISSIEPDLPLLMVSTSRFQTKQLNLHGLPFMHKSEGPQAIIEATINAIRSAA